MDERPLHREQLLVCVKHGAECGELPAAVCACVREPRLSGVCLARAQYDPKGGAISANLAQVILSSCRFTSNEAVGNVPVGCLTAASPEVCMCLSGLPCDHRLAGRSTTTEAQAASRP